MIAIIISANAEWQALKNVLTFNSISITPFGESIKIKQNSEDILFFHGGWGKIDAAASTQYIIDKFSPELIINLGTCGGFEGKTKPLDIIIAQRTIVYDIIERMGDTQEAINFYSSDIDLSWVEDSPNTNLYKTNLVSADQDLDPQNIEFLKNKYNAIAGDWESGAIAHICKRSKTPLLIARAVSDIVTSQEGEAYGEFNLFIQRTQSIMETLLKLLPQWIKMFRDS